MSGPGRVLGAKVLAVGVLLGLLVIGASLVGGGTPDQAVPADLVGCPGDTVPNLAAGLDAPDIESADALYSNDFENSDPGRYSPEDLAGEWATPEWSNGVDDGRVLIAPSGSQGNVLRVSYPSGTYGAGDSGAQWQLRLDSSEAMYVSYLVRFPEGFEFVRGGKLPGLAGGTANTGGNPPDGTDGWSARMMWRSQGCATYYVYYPDQPGQFGEDLSWRVAFQPGVWHRVEQVIVMNNLGSNDGIALGWIDGSLVLERRDLRYRDVDSFAIDMLYFSTFFGGGDPSWAPGEDQFIDFDDFVVAPIDPASLIRTPSP